jgi:hypothetical protein
MAQCIVLLGCSYLEQAMTILKPEQRMKWKPVFGTALGLSDHSVNVVAEEIFSMFDRVTTDSTSVIELNKLTCGQLFDHYARSLNARPVDT